MPEVRADLHICTTVPPLDHRPLRSGENTSTIRQRQHRVATIHWPLTAILLCAEVRGGTMVTATGADSASGRVRLFDGLARRQRDPAAGMATGRLVGSDGATRPGHDEERRRAQLPIHRGARAVLREQLAEQSVSSRRVGWCRGCSIATGSRSEIPRRVEDRVRLPGAAGETGARLPAHGGEEPRADGVSRSAAMAMVGHKTESIYRRYAIVDAVALREAAARIDAEAVRRSTG